MKKIFKYLVSVGFRCSGVETGKHTRENLTTSWQLSTNKRLMSFRSVEDGTPACNLRALDTGVNASTVRPEFLLSSCILRSDAHRISPPFGKNVRGRKQIVLRFVAPMHISEAIRQYAAEVEIDLADIVQFRLDDDDCVSRDYIRRLRRHAAGMWRNSNFAVSFPSIFYCVTDGPTGASITGIVRSLARERQFATVAEQSLISAITKYRNTSLPLQTHIFRALSPMPVTTIRPGMRRRSCANAACLLLTSAQ